MAQQGDNIDHPAHYTQHPSGIECIDITRYLPFSLGKAVECCWNADLENALWYLNDLTRTHWLMVYFNPEKKDLEENLWILEPAQEYATPLGLLLLAIEAAVENDIGRAVNCWGQAERTIQSILKGEK